MTNAYVVEQTDKEGNVMLTLLCASLHIAKAVAITLINEDEEIMPDAIDKIDKATDNDEDLAILRLEYTKHAMWIEIYRRTLLETA